MTTFAIIDNSTGYVWGVVDAADPMQACAKIDAENLEAREYVHGFRGNDGFVVFQAPAGFEVYDGSDEAEIARVEALPEVARIGWVDAE